MLRILLISILAAWTAPALAIYKCESGGKVSYSQLPCPAGNSVTLPDYSETPEPGQARLQAAREKKEAARLEQARHQREASEEKEQQRIAKQRSQRTSPAAQQKCAKLEMRKKWAEDGARSPSLKEPEKASRNAQHLAERYERECGS